jgi:hypothetical protein
VAGLACEDFHTDFEGSQRTLFGQSSVANAVEIVNAVNRKKGVVENDASKHLSAAFKE